MGDQDATPYLDAVIGYAERDPGRFHIPGHKGDPDADPALTRLVGETGLRHDVPALIEGIDVGGHPTPFERASGTPSITRANHHAHVARRHPSLNRPSES